MFLSLVDDLLQRAKTNKLNADDSEKARHWAIVYTELEKIRALFKTYLVEESDL